MLQNLLLQFDHDNSFRGIQVVITLNLTSEDIDLTLFRNIQAIKIRNPIPIGFGENHNNAFLLCKTRWFAVLNPDIELTTPNIFSRLISVAKTIPNLAIIAPRVVNSQLLNEDSVRSNLTPFSLIMRHLFPKSRIEFPAWISNKDTKFYWLAGMCMVFNSEAFKAVGGFNKRYFLYCEDYDISARLYCAGYSLLADKKSMTIHNAQRASRADLRYFLWHISELMKVWTSTPFWKIVLSI